MELGGPKYHMALATRATKDNYNLGP